MNAAEIARSADVLAPLPATATRLAEIIADEHSTVEQLADIIQYDEALAIQVLRLANSVAFSAQRQIGTVRDAVIRLGSGRILELAVAAHVRGAMHEPLNAYGYTEDELWRHSIAAAIATEAIASRARSTVGGICFTAALLHDIGKLFITRNCAAEHMRAVWHNVKEHGAPWEEAEREELGFSHPEVGAHVAAAWRLPESIITAIRNHHVAEYAGDPVTDVVAIANVAARTMGFGLGLEGMSVEVDSQSAERIGLKREDLEHICAVSIQKMQDVLAAFDSENYHY